MLSAHRQDGFSRFLLACRGLAGPTYAGSSRPVLTPLFREYGLPDHILTDNGAPFASNALGRLSRLSVYFVTLGITPSSSNAPSPIRTAATNACTETSKPRPPGPIPDGISEHLTCY